MDGSHATCLPWEGRASLGQELARAPRPGAPLPNRLGGFRCFSLNHIPVSIFSFRLGKKGLP